MQYRTPGILGVGIVQPEEEDVRMSEGKQVVYRKAVGMMIYLVKHSRPDISNSVRELSNVIKSVTEAHYKQEKISLYYQFLLDNFTLLPFPVKLVKW